MKKCLLGTGVTFVLLFITDFIIHGKCLEDLYLATQSLWRSEADMESMMPTMMLGQLLMAVFFSWIFVHGYKGKGVLEGVRYGLLMGGFQAGGQLVMYAVAPYPLELTVSWIVAAFAQSVLLGVALSLIWGKDTMLTICHKT